MESVYQICLEYSENVYFPLKKEAFGQNKSAGSGEICTPIDFNEVSKADVIVAIPEISMGVSVEIGWASCQKKHILIFIDSAYHQSELIRYIDTITPTKKILINSQNGYGDVSDYILFELKKYLDKIMEI
jgi:nucleoside 2-deoxyribosyltransferase